MIDLDEKLRVQEAMCRFGGSFVDALGKALHHADLSNVKRIHDAFPEYWADYNKMALDWQAKQEKR